MPSSWRIAAVPFYRRLDEQESGVGTVDGEGGCVVGVGGGGGRTGALARWRVAEHAGNVGVLVATLLAAHGLNDPEVDFTAHLVQRGDARTVLQEFGRVCRKGDFVSQPCLGNWLASNPLLMASAAYMTDFSNGGEAGAHRGMAALVQVGPGSCRRAELLGQLGSPLQAPCSGCCRCTPVLRPVFCDSYTVVDATAGARALFAEIQTLDDGGGKAWFTRLLVEGAWQRACGSMAEANALFQVLYTSGVLNLAGERPAPSSLVLALRVTINAERASRLLSSEEGVFVSVRSAAV